MANHLFIFSSKTWIGEGKIKLNTLGEELTFFTRWNPPNINENGPIECMQEIQIKGIPEILRNQFVLSDIANGEFSISLENEALGKIEGKGIVNDKVIAWEFRCLDLEFEGFEFYEKLSEDSYSMRAEYETVDQFRTVIEGKIWAQSLIPTEKKDESQND